MDLIQIVDAAVGEALRRSGAWIACRRGCAHCCIGPFAITTIDGERLRQGLKLLPPDRAARILNRALEAAAIMGEPGADEDAFCDRNAGVPCPVLDLETGACELYVHRPIACRLHGPALRVDGVDLRHCRLNYAGASPQDIETCRVEVDPAGAEQRAIEAFEQRGGKCARTYIAFALAAHGDYMLPSSADGP